MSTADTTWLGLGKFVTAVQLLPNSVTSLIAHDTWGADPARATGNAWFNALSVVAGTLGSDATVRGSGTTGCDTERLPTTDEIAARFIVRFHTSHRSEVTPARHAAGAGPHYIDTAQPPRAPGTARGHTSGSIHDALSART